MMKIKKITAKEVDLIIPLCEEYAEGYHERDPKFYRPVVGKIKKTWVAQLKKTVTRRNNYLFVCEKDKKIIGFVILAIHRFPKMVVFDKFGVIGDLAVSKEHQRKGIGKKIIQFAEDFFKSKGIKKVTLNVYVTNPGANALYEKMGYRTDIFVKGKELK